MLIKAALIAINELIEQKKQTDEQNFARKSLPPDMPVTSASCRKSACF